MTTALSTEQTSERLIAIAMLIGAVACFAGLDVSAKWVNRTGDPVQTAGVRYIGAFLLSAMVLNPISRPRILVTHRPWLQTVRALCLVFSTITSFFAFRALPVSQATAISFVAPLFTAVLAGPLLGEWIDRRRAGVVCAGLFGVLIVTRPWEAALHPAMALALLTAAASSAYALETRLLAGADSSATTMFYAGLIGSAVFIPVLPFIWQAPPTGLAWLMLLALGGFGALGHWLMILAHRRVPATILAPFYYLQLVFAVMLAFMVFGEVPDAWTIIGGGVVIGSGLYLFGHERARRATVASG